MPPADKRRRSKYLPNTHGSSASFERDAGSWTGVDSSAGVLDRGALAGHTAGEPKRSKSAPPWGGRSSMAPL
jgi:hypothetical protein